MREGGEGEGEDTWLEKRMGLRERKRIKEGKEEKGGRRSKIIKQWLKNRNSRVHVLNSDFLLRPLASCCPPNPLIFLGHMADCDLAL